MRAALSLVLAAILAAVAAPAFAGDGNVPNATLRHLGLGAMQMISDAEGMQIRGASSSAQGTSLATFTMVLNDPFSGSVINSAGNNFLNATDENAGLNSTSSVTLTPTPTGISAFSFTITTGANTWTASSTAGFTITSGGSATSP